MKSNQTIMIFGAGQIGEACASRILKENPRRVILHTLTEEEAVIAVKNVRRVCPDTVSEIIPSWGNVLVTKELMHVTKKELSSNSLHKKSLIKYYYSYLSDKLIKSSALYYLLKKWKPDYVIDAINTATVVGYQDDPYSLPRNILEDWNNVKDAEEWKDLCGHLLGSTIVPDLIRFTQALQKSIEDFGIKEYIKVSTTGLGGMGVNLLYTHGDVNEPGMSSGILGKVAAAGVIHQLLWSLSHTPNVSVKVIVPAALVGWQPVQFGKFRSHGKNLPLVDSTQRRKLEKGKPIPPSTCKKLKKYMEMPYVDSGENSAYSLAEMTTITSLGQMGCVTREEVAEAVFEAMNGSTRYDLLTAMDSISLGPSFIAAIQRQVILQKMKVLEKNRRVPSIATNNLGPTVSKHLFELHLILSASGGSMKKCTNIDSDKLVSKIEKYIMNNKQVRSQVLSLGLPIILENNEVIMSEYYFVPNKDKGNLVTKSNINKWAESGWVDLRKKQVKYWQSWLKKVYQEVKDLEDNCLSVPLSRNWQCLDDNDIGEILGYIYNSQGGERKTEF